MDHQHTVARERGPYGYMGSVAVHPYTDENRAAHGCVMYIDECQRRRRKQ